MSKCKRRHHTTKLVQQTQSPECSSSPSSPVKEKGRCRDDQHKIKKRHKAKKRLPSSSQLFKKHGLNSESPQAESSDHPLTDDERAKPRSFDSSRVKVQDPGSSRKRSRTSLQRTPPLQVNTVYESEFEFEYKDPAQAKALLKSRLTFRSPPLSPQKVAGLENVTLVSDSECGNKAREVSSSDTDSESERGRNPASPSPSSPSSLQRLVDLKNTTPVSDHDRQHTPRGASLSDSMSESHSVITPESEIESVLPSPALPERVLGQERTTLVSHHDYGQQTRESSTSDADTEWETISEAEPSSEPELSSSSPSPCKTTALKRNKLNIYQSSRRMAVPFPAPSPPDCLREFESEPILPSEHRWSIFSSLKRSIYSEPTIQNFRSEHLRKACEWKKPPAPSESRLNSEIGFATPSRKSVSETEYEPHESERESRDLSPTQTTITPASSPPVPPVLSQVRSRLLSPFPAPQRWLPRLEGPDQESAFIPTVWAPRLRHRCDIKRPKVRLMIDGKRFPRLFAEIPAGGHENIEFIFPDNSDDDPDFDDPDIDDPDSELPGAKRCRVGLTEREESLSDAQESTNPELLPEPEPEPEADSEPDQVIDLGELLDLARSSNFEPLPELELLDPEPLSVLERSSDLERLNPQRSSGSESENPRTPTSIRDELPVWRTRHLNKKIDEAVVIDKEQNPKYWGGSWMKEYARGGEIKKQVEAAYAQEMKQKKEDTEKMKRKRQERDKNLKEKREREKKQREEQRMQQEREEREAQKKKEEERERQRQQKESQNREELERRRARARAKDKPKNVLSMLREMLDEEKRTAGVQARPELIGNQSIAEVQRLQIAIDAVKSWERKKEREREIERGERGV
ncbi:hypothetical protein PEX1_066190 [Penicillium expansum]|nr:hypothetical protein PEX1_066190 [Penicillium expansum]